MPAESSAHPKSHVVPAVAPAHTHTCYRLPQMSVSTLSRLGQDRVSLLDRTLALDLSSDAASRRIPLFADIWLSLLSALWTLLNQDSDINLSIRYFEYVRLNFLILLHFVTLKSASARVALQNVVCSAFGVFLILFKIQNDPTGTDFESCHWFVFCTSEGRERKGALPWERSGPKEQPMNCPESDSLFLEEKEER